MSSATTSQFGCCFIKVSTAFIRSWIILWLSISKLFLNFQPSLGCALAIYTIKKSVTWPKRAIKSLKSSSFFMNGGQVQLPKFRTSGRSFFWYSRRRVFERSGLTTSPLGACVHSVFPILLFKIRFYHNFPKLLHDISIHCRNISPKHYHKCCTDRHTNRRHKRATIVSECHI